MKLIGRSMIEDYMQKGERCGQFSRWSHVCRSATPHCTSTWEWLAAQQMPRQCQYWVQTGPPPMRDHCVIVFILLGPCVFLCAIVCIYENTAQLPWIIDPTLLQWSLCYVLLYCDGRFKLKNWGPNHIHGHTRNVSYSPCVLVVQRVIRLLKFLKAGVVMHPAGSNIFFKFE